MRSLKSKIKFFLSKNKIKYGKDYYNSTISETDIIATTYKHADMLSRILGLNVEVNPKVLKLVINSFYKYGKPYCPCRLRKTTENICPCIYHVEEILNNGRCKCGLFYVRKK